MKTLWLIAVLLIFTHGTHTTQIINAIGSSSLGLLFTALGDVYTNTENPDVRLEYEFTTSQEGEDAVVRGDNVFAATERTVDESRYLEVPDLQMLPLVANGYLPYTSSFIGLVLNGEALAGIFMGNITQWDHPTIVEMNPAISFQSIPITVIYREGSSAGTAVFTGGLSTLSPEWDERYGEFETWPEELTRLDNFIPAVDNTAQWVTSTFTPFSLTYVTFGLLHRQSSESFGVDIIRGNGNTIRCNIESIFRATGNQPFTPRFTASLLNPPDPLAWPISTYSYLLLRSNSTDPEKCNEFAEALRFFFYAATQFTTNIIRPDNGFASQAAESRMRFVGTINSFTCNGEPTVNFGNFRLPPPEVQDEFYFTDDYERYTPISSATYSPFFDSIGSPIPASEATQGSASTLTHLDETTQYFYERFYEGEALSNLDSSSSQPMIHGIEFMLIFLCIFFIL